MLPSPSSSPRAVLEDRLNFDVTPPRARKLALPTPPKELPPRKRPAKKNGQEGGRKRSRISSPVDHDLEDESEEEDPSLFEDDEDEERMDKDSATSYGRARRRTVFHSQLAYASSSAHRYLGLNVSTRPILQSFVSSLKSDVYTCQSLNVNFFLTPPYACSYSHAAKGGGLPLLAVATEEGTVQIINTSKREPWDPEPARDILQPHCNGIFDVKWDRTDTQIVTCSGDHSSRIMSVERKVITHVLHGHTSTVKTMAWDPTNDQLLATGGRDGAICLWDLRTSTAKIEGVSALSPVVTISDAHEDPTKAKVRKNKKHVPMPKSVTSLIYPEGSPYGLVSSGAFDGALRFWDLRKPETPRKSRSTKPKPPPALYSSPADPTTFSGTKRPRGIITLAQGFGPTAGLVFGMGQDSRIHTYTLPTLAAQSVGFADETMQAGSFYVGLSLSPCGNWLACGASNPKSSAFLFEATGAGRSGADLEGHRAVELQGQKGEVGAVDWADGCLATCADDGTVRVWRPDIEVYRQCQRDPDEAQWDWHWSKQVV